MILTQTTLMNVEISEYFRWIKFAYVYCFVLVFFLFFFLLLKSYFFGSSRVLLGEGVQEGCGESKGEHPCRDAILMKLQSNFAEITLWHGCSCGLAAYFRGAFS